jgi:hypothetical protein
MSYQQKRTITMMLTWAAILAAYCIHAFNPARLNALTPGDLKPWAIEMLVFIGIGVAATIVIQIVFHILLAISMAVQAKIQDPDFDEKLIEKKIGSEMVEDEMGKMIALKSNRFGEMVVGAGFVLGLISLVVFNSAVLMLNVFFIGYSLSTIAEGIGQLVYFHRGV